MRVAFALGSKLDLVSGIVQGAGIKILAGPSQQIFAWFQWQQGRHGVEFICYGVTQTTDDAGFHFSGKFAAI